MFPSRASSPPPPPAPAAVGSERGAASSSQSSSGKRIAAEVLRILPADATVDDVLRALAFQRMVYRGLAQADRGDTLSHDELRRRLRSWV